MESDIAELKGLAREGTTSSDVERTRALMKLIAESAPDVAQVALTTLANPASGLAMIIKKIAERQTLKEITEATINEEAEKHFRERIDQIAKSEAPLIEEKEDAHKVSMYLVQEVNKLAEGALKVNDKALMKDVFEFYRKALAQLFLSAPAHPLDLAKLAEIRTELGLIRLRVMWAEAQSSARMAKQRDDALNLRKAQEEEHAKDRLLQQGVLLILLIYVGVITLVLAVGKDFWTSEATIPLLGIPVSVIVWSAFGSLANMLYRYYKQTGLRAAGEELTWVWVRPVLGIIMGVVTYLVIVSGLILIGAATAQNVGPEIKPELLWLFAFVGGFSDGIFEGAIERVGLIVDRAKEDSARLEKLVQQAIARIDLTQEANKTSQGEDKTSNGGEAGPTTKPNVAYDTVQAAPETFALTNTKDNPQPRNNDQPLGIGSLPPPASPTKGKRKRQGGGGR